MSAELMPKLLRPLLIVTLVAALPLVAGLPLAPSLAGWYADFQQSPPGRGTLVGIVVLLLAGDILLPVPSAPLITLAGAHLGWPLTAMAAWAGLTLGAGLALAVTRVLGDRAAHRLVGPQELEGLREACDRHGVWLVLVSRPLPVVAEGVLLTVGLLEPRWWRTLGTATVGNAVVATTLAWLGERAEQHEALAIGVALSIAVPLAATWYVRRAIANRTDVEVKPEV
jgi:uncharacterized membrane protein YdjX (TVP38/TMEM64 family)